MSAHDIRIFGDPILRIKAPPVEVFDAALQATVDEMFATMDEADGIGLAATQVNIPRAFLVVGFPTDNGEIERLFFANPEIQEARGESTIEEGCLSLPGLRVEVVRSEWVRLKFQDIEGQSQELETEGLLARVLQHEIDHLNGILFVDRISPARRALLKSQLDRLAEQAAEGKTFTAVSTA